MTKAGIKYFYGLNNDLKDRAYLAAVDIGEFFDSEEETRSEAEKARARGEFFDDNATVQVYRAELKIEEVKPVTSSEDELPYREKLKQVLEHDRKHHQSHQESMTLLLCSNLDRQAVLKAHDREYIDRIHAIVFKEKS